MYNKPMLSVERELIERFVSDVEAHNYGFDGLEDLRALLDKQVNFLTPDCPDCACVQDGQCLCIPSKPAAQHQGDPVVWVECSPAWLKAGGDCATAPRICVGREGISHLHPAHSNAEQPAPVAVDAEILERFPEINFANYGQDEVEALQAWAFEAYDAIARLNGV